MSDLTVHRKAISRYSERRTTRSPEKRRLKGISRLEQSGEDRTPEQRQSYLSTKEARMHSFSILPRANLSARPQIRLRPLPLQGYKRPREAEHPANHVSTERPRKRLRSLPAGPSFGQKLGQELISSISASQRSHVSHWAKKTDWPEEFFQQDDMYHLLTRKKSTASLRRKRSESSLVTSTIPSDQKSREQKSAPNKNPT